MLTVRNTYPRGGIRTPQSISTHQHDPVSTLLRELQELSSATVGLVNVGLGTVSSVVNEIVVICSVSTLTIGQDIRRCQQ
jgi:hypothetical protein